jgi:2-polyprenyl-3-methyl-5-hydroxy-6-metoxy-1,4-benzoquinol methylase
MTRSCPACGSAPASRAIEVRSYEIRRCRSCASLWVVNPPGEDELAALYDGQGYFQNPDFGASEAGGYHGYLDYLSDREHIERKFAEVLAHVEAQVPTGSLLDVGAGIGLMVSAAGARGWDAIGLDLNEWAVGIARDELGEDVRHGTLGDGGLEGRSFDAVTMMDLLEHVADPARTVAEAARALRPGGVLAVLTPNAGSWVSRVLGRRWPELIRVPEHLILFSARGLGRLLEENGYEVIGWHSVGKASSISTLLADVSPVAPGLLRPLRDTVERRGWGDFEFELDPRTKLCLYARRLRTEAGSKRPPVRRRPPRLPKRAPRVPAEESVLRDLRTLAGATHLADWMFDQFAASLRGRVVEVGAGIGTFSERILGAGASELLLIEPEDPCAETLRSRFAGDPRVRIESEYLPGSPSLSAGAGAYDLVLCQNVLEHIEDDRGAVREMAAALRPGGTLVLLVPGHRSLYGSLDVAYGHRRRYTQAAIRELYTDAGLEVTAIRAFNLLGVLGWYASNRLGRRRVSPASIRVYEAIVRGWRPIEDRLRPPWGLSIVVRGSPRDDR